jgi:hypothetical protein
MNGPRIGSPILVTVSALLLLLMLPEIQTASAGTTRAPGEDLYFEVSFQIKDPMDYTVTADMEVATMMVGADLLSADDLRTLYSTEPDETVQAIEDEMMERVRARVLDAVEGATVTVKKLTIDSPSLEGSQIGSGEPVTGNANLSVRIDPAQFIPASYLSGVDQSRLTYLVSGLVQMGFSVSETYKFTAEPGESFIYRIPSHIYPLGGHSVDLVIEVPGQAVPAQEHVISIAGGSEPAIEMHTFRIRAARPITIGEEAVKGTITADLKDLSSASITATADIRSVELAGTGIAGELPSGVQAPAFLRSGAIRYLALEGALDDEDLDVFKAEISEEAKDMVEDALNSHVTVDVVLDLSLGSLDMPTDDDELNGALSSETPIKLTLDTKADASLNITEGYDPDDVLNLIHGGVVLKHEFDRIDDDRFETRIVLPDHLMLTGKVPLGNVSGRRMYAMPWGLTGIGSDKTPTLTGESVRVTGDVHMDDLRSVYLMDAVIDATADLRMELGWIEYDQAITGTDETIDYEVDYLTSDIIRLILKMGIAKESDLKEKISDSISDFLSGAISDEGIEIVFEAGTLDATDLGEIDGSEPIVARISVESEVDPVNPETGPGGMAASKAYIPRHFDPLLPVRKYQKTVPLGDCSDWDLSLNISFPTGCGVKGWMGKEGSEHESVLETVVQDGCPTLIVRSPPGEHEALYLEISGGLYMAFDNVTVCFFMTWAILAIFLLLVLISITKRIVKRARRNKTVKPKVKEEDLDPNDLWGEKKGKGPDRIKGGAVKGRKGR